MKATIRIITATGRMIERKTTITDYIDDNGVQSSVATVGAHRYTICDRDYYGPVWSIAN